MHMTMTMRLAAIAALVSLGMGSAIADHHNGEDQQPASAEPTHQHDMSGMSGMSGQSGEQAMPSPEADPHAMHKNMMHSSDVKVTHAAYVLPAVKLVNESGQSVALQEVLGQNRAVVVNFIFSTCTTICPVMTSTMLQLQKLLKDDASKPYYVSISIDPDYDSADVMRKYAARYGADWTFLTGTSEDIMTTLQALDAYRGNKVNHFALTLMRAADDPEWTRVEGLGSAQELADIWHATAM